MDAEAVVDGAGAGLVLVLMAVCPWRVCCDILMIIDSITRALIGFWGFWVWGLEFLQAPKPQPPKARSSGRQVRRARKVGRCKEASRAGGGGWPGYKLATWAPLEVHTPALA